MPCGLFVLGMGLSGTFDASAMSTTFGTSASSTRKGNLKVSFGDAVSSVRSAIASAKVGPLLLDAVRTERVAQIPWPVVLTMRYPCVPCAATAVTQAQEQSPPAHGGLGGTGGLGSTGGLTFAGTARSLLKAQKWAKTASPKAGRCDDPRGNACE